MVIEIHKDIHNRNNDANALPCEETLKTFAYKKHNLKKQNASQRQNV